MPTTTPLTDAINALTTYANETTGAGDTTLSEAVNTLVEGYGQGGGGFSIEDYLGHQFTGSATLTDSNVGYFSLQKQTGITSLSFPNVTTLANVSTGGFSEMTGLTTFYAPKAQRQPGSLLNGCSSLVNVNLDGLEDTGNLLLSYCTSLTTVVLPSVKNIYSQTVRGCTNLEAFDVLASNGFTNQNNMNGCTKLNKLIIRKNGVATLSNVNNFTGTPFASGGTGGEIYVPSAQISSYKTANNWSTIHGYGTITWKAIEGSYYETHYADGRTIE